MKNGLTERARSALFVVLAIGTVASTAHADSSRGSYGGVHDVVKFDISPALRDIPPIPPPRAPEDWGGLIVDPPGFEGRPEYGPQDEDPLVQGSKGPSRIPDPIISFGSINTQGFTPPDPIGDIGPNHYVAMSNVQFQVYDRTGSSLYGPAANNTLWSGFGGPCQTQNAGDPIVLYDQFADRWLLTQFTASPEAGTGNFYNCVALSQGPDPMGPWYRWQINNGASFPDYPKYGVGEDAYYLSTRNFQGVVGPYLGVGAFALNRAEMVAGDETPTVISFFVSQSPDPENIGDGLLPMDIDGSNLPPMGSPHYFAGTMDDGGPYLAPQDAITIWEFIVDFGTPPNSSFVLAATIPIAPVDTIFPCQGAQGRQCIPQPNTANKVDHQGYRQRPLHRLAYRNYGAHESLVTNQSVEAAPGISGVRWWEIRSPGSAPYIHQEGTYAPGVEDGVHRWFGSTAMDSAGNIALGYSASNERVYPSIWYTGRLFSDLPGEMPQGEGVIVDGTGSQTGGGQRWGDYSSMNVDPLDDCTFWYVNEYIPVTSPAGWRMQVGAFKFGECGEPGFSLSIYSEPELSICRGDDAVYDFNIGSVEGFTGKVSLGVTGNPAPSSASFDVNPVTAPGMSTLTIGNTAGVAAGDYAIDVTGTAAAVDDRAAEIDLLVFDGLPATPVLVAPADGAMGVALNPDFGWTVTNEEESTIEVATDPGFSNIVFTQTLDDDEVTPFNPLASSTQYYWRVRGGNACGTGPDSAVFTFTTLALPGDCPAGLVENVVYHFDFESGAQGWTHNATAGPDTWTLSGANPISGAQHWHADDHSEVSDQRLVSPVMAIPNDLTELTFRFFDYQNLEANPPSNCWDGGILEVSTNRGANFAQVGNPDLLTNPYDGSVTDGPNPLSKLQAWCGAPQPYTDTRVDISGLAGGTEVMFRFRLGTDAFVGAPGWDIDDVRVVGCENPDVQYKHGFEDSDG